MEYLHRPFRENVVVTATRYLKALVLSIAFPLSSVLLVLNYLLVYCRISLLDSFDLSLRVKVVKASEP